MANLERFWGVFNAKTKAYVETYDSEPQARNAAQDLSKRYVGDTFVVLECKEAFTATVSVERVYLDWPAAVSMPEEPPAFVSANISI